MSKEGKSSRVFNRVCWSVRVWVCTVCNS